MTPVVEWDMPQAPSDFSATRAAASAGVPWFGSFALDFVTPQLGRTLEVWRAKRGSRTMPARGDLTISDLKFALANLGFIDIVRDGDRLRFRVRLMGSVLDTLVTPMSGRYIDESVPAHFAQKWATQWMPAIERRAPMRAVGRVEFGERRWFVAETLHAPLAQDGERPDILLVVAYYHAIDRAEASSRDIAARLLCELEANESAES